jgi:voltage-gated sodium channel
MSSTAGTRGAASLRRIEQSRVFQGAVIAVIVLSALAIGAKTYDIPPAAAQALGLMDMAITLFFLVEIVFRFVACPDRRRFFSNGWNVFDTVVVLGSLVPLQNADAILIGRLLRVFRVLRLVSVVPELRSLITALLKAIPRMGYIALLMFLIFYIYGAIGSLIFDGIDQELWGDVAIAMLTLFRVATFEDWTDVMYQTMEVYPLSWLYYLSFIFLTAFVFLNMMVGTILEVMTEERDEASRREAHDERHNMAEQLARVEQKLDRLESRRSDAPDEGSG